jgi:hypothetical protein
MPRVQESAEAAAAAELSAAEKSTRNILRLQANFVYFNR